MDVQADDAETYAVNGAVGSLDDVLVWLTQRIGRFEERTVHVHIEPYQKAEETAEDGTFTWSYGFQIGVTGRPRPGLFGASREEHLSDERPV